MDDRTFGVELEFNTNRQGGINFARRILSNTFPEGSAWRNCNFHRDGSELELPSPILKGEEGIQELKTFMQALADNGCKVNRMDGMHVHHGAAEFRDRALLARAYESWFNNQAAISKFVAKRRHGAFVCNNVVQQHVDTIKAGGIGPGKYFNFNIQPLLGNRGTIEVRYHEGTLVPDYAEAWVEFGQAFFRTVLNAEEPLPKKHYAKNFLKAIELDDKFAKILLDKAYNRKEEPQAAQDEFYAPVQGGWV